MITRLEAIRYRYFERIGVDVSDLRVLVGANASNKTNGRNISWFPLDVAV